MQTLKVKAKVGSDGHLHVDVPTTLAAGEIKALLLFDDDKPSDAYPMEPALLSEKTLAEDWEGAEEDEAWAHLQPATLS